MSTAPPRTTIRIPTFAEVCPFCGSAEERALREQLTVLARASFEGPPPQIITAR